MSVFKSLQTLRQTNDKIIALTNQMSKTFLLTHLEYLFAQTKVKVFTYSTKDIYTYKVYHAPQVATIWTVGCADTVEQNPGQDRISPLWWSPSASHRNERPWGCRGSAIQRWSGSSKTITERTIAGWGCWQVFACRYSPRRRSWGSGASPVRPNGTPSGKRKNARSFRSRG